MKKSLPWGELGFLAAILCYVVYYFATVREYSYKAKFWPELLMAAAVILVGVVAVSIIKNAPEKDAAAEGVSLKEWVKAKSPILVVIVSIIVYTVLLKKLGLHLCNFLLSFFLVLYLTKGKWKTALVTAVILTLSFYLVFDFALGMRLPKFKLFKIKF